MNKKREEKWMYQPLSREILGRLAYREDASHLTKPDIKLIKWLAKEGGKNERAVDAILDCAYRGLLGGFGAPNGEERSDAENDMRTYSYVPSSRVRFVRSILPLFYGKRRFVDVGSGYADKPLLAHVYGKFDTVTGIEINAFTHSAAVLLLGSLFNEENISWHKRQRNGAAYIYLVNEDAFGRSYHKYDAVYMYMPIAEVATMTKLHVHVINTMPVGGMLYEVQTGLFNRRTWDEDREEWWECRCMDCREGDECEEKGSISFFEYAEEVGAPIKRDIDITHERHLITIRR